MNGNILDLIITPVASELLLSAAQTTSLISDHYAVECNIRCTKPHAVKQDITYRKLKTVDNEAFSLELELKTSNINNIDDYNLATRSLVDKHAPIICRTIVVRNHKPWHNADIRSAKQKL